MFFLGTSSVGIRYKRAYVFIVFEKKGKVTICMGKVSGNINKANVGGSSVNTISFRNWCYYILNERFGVRPDSAE